MVSPSENVPHSAAFFAQMRTRRDAYRLLGECFAKSLASLGCASAYDFGCGVGFQDALLAECGVGVIGYDPFTDVPEPGFKFRRLDPIANPPAVQRDAVICTETAEHVYESRANDLVFACTSAATKMIIFSAAVPGQEWEGHVNLKPHAWWIEKFEIRGWVVSPELTHALRDRMLATSAQHCGAAENFFVMVRA